MKPDIVMPYWHWGHQHSRSLIIAVVVVLMSASVGFRSYDLLAVISQSSSALQAQPAAQTNTVMKPQWHINDFVLLFGTSMRTDTAPGAVTMPKTKLDLTLRGAMAEFASAHDGSAIIRDGDQEKLYRPGDQLPGGATLLEVHADHVVLDRGGQLETLCFPDDANVAIDALPDQLPVSPVSPHPKKPQDKPNQLDSKTFERQMQELIKQLQQMDEQGL